MAEKSKQALRLESDVRVRRMVERAVDGEVPGSYFMEVVEEMHVAPSELDPFVNNALAQSPTARVVVEGPHGRTTWTVPTRWAAS